MSQTYQTRRRPGTAPAAKEIQIGAAGPSVGELAAGAQPTQEQMGSRVDLPGEIREKMESSFLMRPLTFGKVARSMSLATRGAQ